MNKKSFLFTSEAVTEGHPDRLCDLISDALVDRFLRQDPYSRVVAECALSKSVVFLAARIASKAAVDLPETARDVIGTVGYRPEDFDASDCTVVTSLINMPLDQRPAADERSLPDEQIDTLIVRNHVTVFGFACRQTEVLMPLPIVLANRIARRLTEVRRCGAIRYLSPDCTVQVGVAYEQGRPTRLQGLTIIAGYQSSGRVDPSEIRDDLEKNVLAAVFANATLCPDAQTEIFINPQGAFPRSGPSTHSGMTGRKTAADTYGAYARHSGSALSGKDPTRIDRVGVYAARYAAKNIVASGLADECEIQLSYGIGHAAPISVQVETFGTGELPDAELQRRVERTFDFRLGAIIRDFNLRYLPAGSPQGFYGKLPASGHLANESLDLPWERTDKATLLL